MALKLFIGYLCGVALALIFSAIGVFSAKVKGKHICRGEWIVLFLFNPLVSFLSAIPFTLWILYLFSPKAASWLKG